jgi:uncharacterized protein YlxP (DUF503 family)
MGELYESYSKEKRSPITFLEFWCKYYNISVVNVEYRDIFDDPNIDPAIVNQILQAKKESIEKAGIDLDEVDKFYRITDRDFRESTLFDGYVLKEIKDTKADVIIGAFGGTHAENIARMLYDSKEWSRYNQSFLFDYKIAKNKPAKHLRYLFPLIELEKKTLEDRNEFAIKNIKEQVLKMVPSLQKNID